MTVTRLWIRNKTDGIFDEERRRGTVLFMRISSGTVFLHCGRVLRYRPLYRSPCHLATCSLNKQMVTIASLLPARPHACHCLQSVGAVGKIYRYGSPGQGACR